jgi:hypothetical protein
MTMPPAMVLGQAATTLSDLRGVTRDAGGLLPVPEAQVLVHDVDEDTDRTVVSDASGVFIIKNLNPGHYQLKASKEGFKSSSLTRLDLAAGQSLSVDVPLGAKLSAPASRAPQTPGGFFRRFAKAYRDDWKPAPAGAVTAPAPAFRGDPPPVDGPPFPFSTWPIGGTVTIGYPWTQASPLMQALWAGRHGEAWKKSGVQIYGWLNFGGNFSTSKSIGGKYGNFPTAYDAVPNAIEPDQEVLYIERQPNTVQTDHFDWGFRLTALWGIDYRFTTARGYFSQQLLNTGATGKQYGFDPVMMYIDLYFPHIAQGMDIRIGRYISLPDIEAQLAPNNYTYSHSLTYTFDCYTQTGINTTTRLNDHWTVQVGVSPGCEVQPFLWRDKYHDAKLTLNACVQYQWRQNKDAVYVCDNSTNSGNYAYNNLQAYYATWYHVFSKNWHSSTEYWYMWMKNVPNVANPTNPIVPETNSNGAICKTTTQLTCFAPEHAIVNYLEHQVSPHDYISIRNEFFDDMRGQRTGFKTRYSEHLIGWGHWIGTTVLFRPELRYEHSYDSPSYQNGTKTSQLTAAGDIIWFF